MKPYLSHGETLPLANLFYVNRSITIEHPCNHLSANTLPKTSKIAVFSTDSPFRCQHPLFFGVKIRILFDNSKYVANGVGSLLSSLKNYSLLLKEQY